MQTHRSGVRIGWRQFVAGLSLAAAASWTAAGAAEVVFPDVTWRTGNPQELRLDKSKLDQFAARVGGAGCVIKDGYLVASWGDQEEKRDWASAAKPVLATLLLFAVHEGKLPSIDSLVRDVGWKLRPKDQTMTFRHLANMVSGYGRGEPPGEAWAYNDYAIELYALSLQKVFGQTLDQAVRQRLAPLQLEDGSIFSSRKGLGVKTTPRDFARIGWFWLNCGSWNGRQLLPREYFQDYVKVGVPADTPRSRIAGPDYLKVGSYGGATDQTPYGPGVYGLNWWFNAVVGKTGHRVWPAAPPDAYQANGMWNRDVVTVIPSLNMVVAFCGGDLGKFEPGRADGQANRNMKLLAGAVE